MSNLNQCNVLKLIQTGLHGHTWMSTMMIEVIYYIYHG